MLLLASILGCRSDDPTDPQPLHLEPVDGNPLVPHVPLYPWPSDLWLVDAPGTVTGRRLEVPEELAPAGADTSVLSGDDGFSPAAPILAWLAGGVDPATLPDLAGSIAAGASVRVVRVPDGAAVPVLAEVDARVTDPNVQALIVRPQITLEPATTYAVVLTDDLRTVDGEVHEVEDAFRALRDGLVTDDPVVESLRQGTERAIQAGEAAGVAREHMVLAWAFTTRSEQDVVGGALALQDAAATADLPPWTRIDEIQEGGSTRISGTFVAPDWLGEDLAFELGADELPVLVGDRTVEFLLDVPDTVDEPRPVVVFGHGFFSSKEEITWSSFQGLAQDQRFPSVAIDFIGFSEADIAASSAALTGDLAALSAVVDQQLQSQAQFTLLARLVREQLAADVVVDRGGTRLLPLDPARLRYMGASNGGTQGAVIVATSPVLRDGVLVVPGGAWSHMTQRAVQWDTMGALLELKYPNPLDLQLVLAMTQQLFDRVDSVNFARGLGSDPFEGRSPPRVQLHMAVGDSQVANMVTEWLARSAQVPLVVRAPLAVWGLEELSVPPPGSTTPDRALFVYDEGVPPYPGGNLSPPEDNGTHDSVRDLPSYRAQVSAFLSDGTYVQVCEGPCDPD